MNGNIKEIVYILKGSIAKCVFLIVLALSVSACATDGENRLGSETDQDYTLTFDGFSPNEVLEFEDTLTRFSEYRSHRLVYSGERHAEYVYSMALSAERLNNSLRAILGSLELKSLVRFSADNHFELKKVVTRKNKGLDQDYSY